MRVIMADSALDALPPSRTPALRRARRGARLLGITAQSLMVFAVLWLLTAGPGFLSARDSLVPAASGRPADQASR